MDLPENMDTAWCAFAPGKEAWKHNGNFFTANELQEIDNADDMAVYQPMDFVLSAD
jgi:hypothetical protein